MKQRLEVTTSKTTINRAIKIMLAVFGIWPRTSYVMIIRTYWIITSISDEICICRYFFTHRQSSDFSDFVDGFSAFLAYIKITSKLIILWLKQRKFIETITLMAEDWDDCARSDDDMREAVCKAKLSNHITNAILTLHALTMIMYSLGVILSDVDFTDPETELPLIFKIELPVEISTQRAHKLLLAAQFVQLMMCGCGAGLINALLLTLILHLGGQADILCSWINELVSKDNGKMDESIAISMTKIIRKHQKIIIFAECIEDLYTYIALIVFTTNTVLICLLEFLIITALGNPNMVQQIGKSLLFYAITSLEAFIFCYAGEYVKNKSKAVGTAAYISAWYKLRPGKSRALMLLILRAQKHLMLTVGKMMELSLESFTNIMKISISYLSVVLAMQS